MGISSVERFVGDEAIEQRWSFDPPTESSGKRVLIVGAGPPASPPPTTWRRGHEVTISRGGADGGGMMRFGIPKYRLPQDVLDAEVQRILDMGIELHLNSKVTNVEESMNEGASTRRSSRSAPTSASAPTSRPVRPRTSSMPSRSSSRWRARSGRCWATRWSSSAEATPRWTSPGLGQAPWRHRRRGRLPPHPRADARARIRGRGGRGGGRDDALAETIKQVDGGKVMVEKMELDETGFPQPTGEIEELEAHSVILALGQEADLLIARGGRGDRGRGRDRPGRGQHDDRAPGDLRGRRHGPRGAHRHGRDRSWQKRCPQHRRLASG